MTIYCSATYNSCRQPVKQWLQFVNVPTMLELSLRTRKKMRKKHHQAMDFLVYSNVVFYSNFQ